MKNDENHKNPQTIENDEMMKNDSSSLQRMKMIKNHEKCWRMMEDVET